jgi:5'-nucleotidase / UDP-sugar diphosphatase
MKKYILILIIPLFALSCKVREPEQKGTNDEIIILHTNDIHGSIANFPRLAFMVDSIRKIHKTVFLLNAGDIFTGNPYVDMYKDKGYPVIDLMNDIGFDLSAFGNHEFDYGQDILNLRIKQAKFPFICGNIELAGGSLNIPKASVQLKTNNGLKINIFSLIENAANGLPQSHPTKLKGLKFANGLETADKYKQLAKGANVFIALTHLGIDSDLKLAKQMPELDLIIGGHSHTVLDSGKTVNGVLVVQAGSNAKYLGEITLNLKNGRIIKKEDKLLPVLKSGSIDLKMKEKVEIYNKNPYFDEVLGHAAENFANTEEIGSFVTDAYRDFGKSDMAFQNSGGIRISQIDKGNITRGLIFNLDPFGNKLVVLDMKLSEIKSMIINSFNNEIDLRVSGINYNVITDDNGKVKDVIVTDYKGTELNSDKIYKVSMNDYIFKSYKFDHTGKAEILEITTAEVVIGYLKKGPLNYSGVKRTFINGK